MDLLPKPANDNRKCQPSNAATLKWNLASVSPPDGLTLMVWVHGPFIGVWDQAKNKWFSKADGVNLEPVRFWAEIPEPLQ